MGTNTGQVMTLANSIIGVSILAMPFCFKQCGIVLSILLLCLSSLLSRFACHFLLKAAIITRRRNYEFLAFHVFGSSGKLGVELAIIGFLVGTCIAFFVVMGDLGPAIISSMLGLHRTDTLRTSILVGMALFVVLPLGLLRNVDSLSSLCTATFAFYLCFVLKVVGEAAGPLVSGNWLDELNFWRPEGIWQCAPIFSMALFCQTQLFEIFDTVPNVALDKLNAVVRVAINLCTAVYISVGFFGYVAFSKENITGNILVSLSESMSSEVIKLGFVLSVAVSFPLVIFPCRASLYSLLYRSAQPPLHDVVASHVPEGRFKTLTFGIVGISLVLGLLLPNIERVLGIIGSTIGVTICIITPALLLVNTARHSRDRLISQVIMFLGAVIMILGTYTHVLNSEQSTGNDLGLEQAANRILDHAVDQLNEQPPAAMAFQPLPSDQNVKKLIEMSEEKVKALHSESFAEKSKVKIESNFEKSVVKKSEIAAAPTKPEKIAAKFRADTAVVEKSVKAVEKLQEPPIPADTGEKQQEPPIPVEVVVKPVSAEPVPVMPAPSSETISKDSKPTKQKKITEEQNILKDKPALVSNGDQVNQDAIRHEDVESALEARDEKEKSNIVEKLESKQNDPEDQKKKAEEQKLMETLKEHQEVQRDMLNEQQRILKELKKHDHGQQKTLNEVAKDSPINSKLSLNLSAKVSNKTQGTADKQNSDALQLSEKDSAKNEPAVLKKTYKSAVSNDQLNLPLVLEGKLSEHFPEGSKFGKVGSGPVIPLPLAYSAKVSSTRPPAKLPSENADSKPAARDILESGGHQFDREKRDVVSVGNIEPEQGAGSGPVVEAGQKEVGDELNLMEDNSNKECRKDGKDIQISELQDSVNSLSLLGKNVIAPKIAETKKLFSNPKAAILPNTEINVNQGVLKKLELSKSTGEFPAIVELKTPSSISEPHVEIRTDLHSNAEKYPHHDLPIQSTNRFQSVQSKEGK